MEIRVKVAAARISQGRSIGDVARASGIDPVHLTRFERGLRDMSSDKLGRVLDALGLLADDHEPSEVAFEDLPTAT